MHVGVGSSLQQGLCDLCHAGHNFCRVFLGAERADQVEWGLHRAHRGCIHLSRVPNQKDGGKLVPWRRQRNILKRAELSSYNRVACAGEKEATQRVEQIPLRTSLDGLVQEAPATLIHHVHISFVVDQSCCNAFKFTGESEIQRKVAVVVQLV